VKSLKDLSGKDLIRSLCAHWNYVEHAQEGLHFQLRTHQPSIHKITIPDQPVLNVKTINAVLLAVARHKGTTKEHIIKTLEYSP